MSLEEILGIVGRGVVIIAKGVEITVASLGEAEEVPPEGRDGDLVMVGTIRLDLRGRVATSRGRRLPLSTREMQVLEWLAREPGRASSFEELSERLWGGELYGDYSAIRSTIKRLRSKLREADSEVTIASVRGVGFRLECDEADVKRASDVIRSV